MSAWRLVENVCLPGVHFSGRAWVREVTDKSGHYPGGVVAVVPCEEGKAGNFLPFVAGIYDAERSPGQDDHGASHFIGAERPYATLAIARRWASGQARAQAHNWEPTSRTVSKRRGED